MITVVHTKSPKSPAAQRIYVGRGSGSHLGNPFSHVPGTLAKYQVESREEAIKQYREWLPFALKDSADVHAQLDIIRLLHKAGTDIELACWCTPLPCHADVIKEFIERSV